jgi:hypothetical protein
MACAAVLGSALLGGFAEDDPARGSTQRRDSEEAVDV